MGPNSDDRLSSSRKIRSLKETPYVGRPGRIETQRSHSFENSRRYVLEK